jgi:hypothetical protein
MINVKAALNDTSIGNVSVNILRELYKAGVDVSLFPIQNTINLNAFDELDSNFLKWISFSYENRLKTVNKNNPTLQIWHINGSESKLSDKSFLYTFYEMNRPTPTEVNLCRTHEKVFFSSSHAKNCFLSSGLKDCQYIPIGFDADIKKTNKKYLQNKIHFGLMGKLEKRKHTLKILELWSKRFGNNSNFELTCAITNRFIPVESLNQQIGQALQGEHFDNINFIPFLSKNSEINELMNAVDIDLTGLSGAEGWNLPAFNTTCLGKWSCVLNATSHKDWANENNSILVEPTGKEESHDGIFFQKNSNLNQGDINNFSAEQFCKCAEDAINKVKAVNTEGEKLKEEFSYKKSVNSILEHII